MAGWKIFSGNRQPHDGIEQLPAPPPWRDFRRKARGATFQASPDEIELVNAALYLRRPLLITGPPGSGKTSLAYAVAWELKLGNVLRWSINSRSTLQDGLYRYDALARLRDSTPAGVSGQATTEGTNGDIGRYIKLGPLGTALLPQRRPRLLLVDEIDKSDIDLPNDLLHVFEEGEYEIPELVRIASKTPEGVLVLPDDGESDTDRVLITGGRVRCDAFPFVIITSNGERELPPAFMRRCLRLDILPPSPERLADIIRAHLKDVDLRKVEDLLQQFVEKRDAGGIMATDQLLNSIFLMTRGRAPEGEERKRLLEVLLRELGG